MGLGSDAGIVSVWAEADGRATVWRRLGGTGELVREEERFRPWLLLDRLDDLRHGRRAGLVTLCSELDGPARCATWSAPTTGRR